MACIETVLCLVVHGYNDKRLVWQSQELKQSKEDISDKAENQELAWRCLQGILEKKIERYGSVDDWYSTEIYLIGSLKRENRAPKVKVAWLTISLAEFPYQMIFG